MTTLVSEAVHRSRCESENVDYSKVCVVKPRWAETGPKTPSSRSALVRCDLILRDDGTAVALDGATGMDSMALIENHKPVDPEQWD